MKITSIKPILLSSKYGNGNVLGQPLGVKSLGFVEVKTDNGFVGYGESYCAIYIPEIFENIINFISNNLIGLEWSHPKEVFEKYHIPFVTASGTFRSAFSAIDIALWDIYSKSRKRPIHRCIQDGSTSIERNLIRVYASGGSAAFSPNEIQNDLSDFLNKGHYHYKMRVGFQDWIIDQERVKVAKSMLNNSSSLMVDAIMGTIQPSWTVEQAKSRERDLRKFGLEWLEEPLNPFDTRGYIELKKDSEIKLACGEALTSMAEFFSFIPEGIDIIQPDVTHCGGISAAIEICKIAKLNKVPVAMHVWGSPIAFNANMEIALAFDNVDWLEVPSVKLDISSEMSSSISVINGEIRNPSNVGFPVKINDNILNQYPFVKGSGFRFPDLKSK